MRGSDSQGDLGKEPLLLCVEKNYTGFSYVIRKLCEHEQLGGEPRVDPGRAVGLYFPPGLGKPLDPHERAGRQEIKNVWVTLINFLPQ